MPSLVEGSGLQNRLFPGSNPGGTSKYVWVMQRKTSLFQEQSFVGSNPTLHTNMHGWMELVYTLVSKTSARKSLRVRVPLRVPYVPMVELGRHARLRIWCPRGCAGSNPVRHTLCTGGWNWVDTADLNSAAEEACRFESCPVHILSLDDWLVFWYNRRG